MAVAAAPRKSVAESAMAAGLPHRRGCASNLSLTACCDAAGTRAAHKDTVHAYCFPIQVATGETSAMQKLALGTRIILEHGTAAVVSGDAENAYNSLERASLLRFLASPEAEEAGLLPLLPAAHAQLSLATQCTLCHGIASQAGLTLHSHPSSSHSHAQTHRHCLAEAYTQTRTHTHNATTRNKAPRTHSRTHTYLLQDVLVGC